MVTEEDVKLKIVVPLLESLGIARDEVRYEKSFTIRIGTTELRIDAKGQPTDLAHARLDILVKRGDDNLFVVESKAPGLALEDKDVGQAVSYARLVHPLAPYCILTNGTNTRLIDTLTKQDVAAKDLPPMPPGFQPALSDDLRHEAVKLFLGYSRANLLAFCRLQVDGYMKALRAQDLSPAERRKKYVPNLYEASEATARQYERFRTSRAQCFVLVGESGVGKTCWLCHTAIARLESGEPTLFYRAEHLRNGVLAALGGDLNWTLSPSFPEASAARRFLDIFEGVGVSIFIDGIDEPGAAQSGPILDDFLRRVAGRPELRVVATCKSATWPGMLERSGVPTELASAAFREGGQAGARAEEAEDGQLARMIQRYRAGYGVHGLIEHRLYEDFKRSPFLLHVAFEAAVGGGDAVLSSTSADLYKLYLDKALGRFDGDKLRAGRFVDRIANRLYELNASSAEEEALREAIGITSPSEDIPAGLFECNILARQGADGASGVGFYFDRIRDHVIAFRARKWLNAELSDMPKLLSEASSGVRRSAIEHFFQLAPPSHRAALAGPAHVGALAYVTAYEAMLREHFGAFARGFPPETDGEIGFIGYVDLPEQRVRMYGFRLVARGTEKVVLLPGGYRNNARDNRAFLAGATTLRSGGATDFRPGAIQASVFQNDVIRGLLRAVKRGALDERCCPEMVIERVAAVAGTHFRGEFGPELARSPFQYARAPLSRIREAVLARRNLRALRHELTERKLASGAIVPQWHGASQFIMEKTTPAEERGLRSDATEQASRWCRGGSPKRTRSSCCCSGTLSRCEASASSPSISPFPSGRVPIGRLGAKRRGSSSLRRRSASACY